MIYLLSLTPTKQILVCFHCVILRSDLKLSQTSEEPLSLGTYDRSWLPSLAVLPSHPRLQFNQKEKQDAREKGVFPLPSSNPPFYQLEK